MSIGLETVLPKGKCLLDIRQIIEDHKTQNDQILQI